MPPSCTIGARKGTRSVANKDGSQTIANTQPSVTSIDDLVAFSRERIEQGSKSFAVAARLFPTDVRASAYMLYAWCRHCDDVVDGQTLGFNDKGLIATPDDIRIRVAELKTKTLEACNNRATEPVFQALSTVCRRHDIPDRHPLDLIAGFEMDAEERTYETIEDTLEYCYHVAGVVGVMMAMVMGARDRNVLLHAADLGLAFQMTNIARDVVPDHATGRVYLPSQWLDEAGLDRTTMALPENRKALFSVADRLLRTAEPYYHSAAAGVPHLPFRSAWAVAAARAVYREIGLNVQRQHQAAWDTRAGTSKAQKLAGVAQGLAAAFATRRLVKAPASSVLREGLWTKSDH